MVIQKPYNLNKSRIPTTLPVALSVLQLQHNSLNRRGWWQAVLNARLRTLSILLADNDDIRFLSALGIFSSETGYGQIFDRSWFLKKNSQVLVKIECRRCQLTELTQHSTFHSVRPAPPIQALIFFNGILPSPHFQIAFTWS